MTAAGETDSSLATQCLDFCQALARQGKVFKFSLTIGSTFTFSLDTKEGKANLPSGTQRRKSPSTLRRNAKRREEFFAKKSTLESSGLESNRKQCEVYQCDQCDSSFKTVNGLKIHKGKSHKEASSPEKLRKSHSQPSLIVSPVKDLSRVESCHNCDMEMSPTHLCHLKMKSKLCPLLNSKRRWLNAYERFTISESISLKLDSDL